MNPLVSIIIPCYNQASFIQETIASVINQSYTNWECIIVNDGSTDPTGDKIQTAIHQDTRFTYVETPNEGVSAARNKAIRIAQGKYILPLDGDDLLNPDYVTLATQVLEKNSSIGLICSNTEFFGSKSGVSPVPDFDWRSFLASNTLVCSCVFRRSDFEATSGYDTQLKHGLEDWEFWISLLATTQKKVHKLDYVGLQYRIQESSRNADLMKTEDFMTDSLNYIYTKHKDVYEREFGSYMNSISRLTALEKENKRFVSFLNTPLIKGIRNMHRWFQK